jgi:Reverse transcriptase (RNA-dependent DNA polymerase).
LRKIIEEIKNHKKETALIFIDFRKAFDSIDRNKVRILLAYGISPAIVDAIRVMYITIYAVTMKYGLLLNHHRSCSR